MKWYRDEALAVARVLITRLEPATSRIVIAGSLRRGKSMVGDVELLYIPGFIQESVDMFSTRPVDLTDTIFDTLLAEGVITKRRSVNGNFVWGPKNKLAVHSCGIPVDFFSTSDENWWVSLVVRTGSKETNLKLTTGAQRRGDSLNAYGSGVTHSDHTVTNAISEQHVFELCGVPYLEPHLR